MRRAARPCGRLGRPIRLCRNPNTGTGLKRDSHEAHVGPSVDRGLEGMEWRGVGPGGARPRWAKSTTAPAASTSALHRSFQYISLAARSRMRHELRQDSVPPPTRLRRSGEDDHILSRNCRPSKRQRPPKDRRPARARLRRPRQDDHVFPANPRPWHRQHPRQDSRPARARLLRPGEDGRR